METRYRKYYEPTEREQLWGLSVRGVGSYHATSGDIDFSGRLFPSFIMALIVNGSGTFWPEPDHPEKINSGTLIRVAPHTWHRYHPDENVGWKQHWVVFDGAYAELLYNRGVLGPPRSYVSVGHDDLLVHGMERLVETSRSETPFISAELRGLLFQVIQRGSELVKRSALGSRLPAVHAMMDHIERHWRDSIHVEDLSAKFGLSDSHLRRLFRRETGMSPRDYQLSIRINNAKSLLEQQHMTVQEVAWAVGMEDQYYFSRLFKARTGVPPSHWCGM